VSAFTYHKNRRLRVFAGPNGSGKSTIFNQIGQRFDMGIYLNADLLEKHLRDHGSIRFSDFNVTDVEEGEFENFRVGHSMRKTAIERGLQINLSVKNNVIFRTVSSPNSYEAALITDFIRRKLIAQGSKLSFETVMSHPSKDT